MGEIRSVHRKYDILIPGASYGSPPGPRLPLAGHGVHVACLPAQAERIDRVGKADRWLARNRAPQAAARRA